jgi:serine/threonine protein kinase
MGVLPGLSLATHFRYMHRDLKPENLLIRGTDCKVADFSLVRGVSLSVNDHKMTSYVSTRWYRAPELILCAPIYTTAVDLFAVGCIMAELVRLRPLFPGSGEVEQLHLILKLLGPLHDWPEGVQLSTRFGLEDTIPTKPTPLTSVKERLEKEVPMEDPKAISFLASLLALDPSKRLSARDAEENEYFGANVHIPSSPAADHRTNNMPNPNMPNPKVENSNDFFATTTPLRITTDETASINSRVPLVSISPSMRNIPLYRGSGTFFRSSVPRFDGFDSVSAYSLEGLPIKPIQEQVGPFEVVPISEDRIVRQPKRQRMGYRPAQAFNVD